MMWGKPPFFIPDNYAIQVRNLKSACDWYRDKPGLREVHDRLEDDSGRPFADLGLSNEDIFLTLVELGAGDAAEKPHVMFYAKNLEKARQWLVDRGVTTEPVTSDSGGNQFFRFRDLEGNAIEVCVEPG